MEDAALPIIEHEEPAYQESVVNVIEEVEPIVE